MLEHFFRDKDKWKEDAFNLIKSDLLSVKNNRFVQYNQSASTHLVCVYGKSQVGKTTLILNMIGLKDEFKKDVSDVLRGGVARGNSSTSTAIIYSHNTSDDTAESDKYGLRLETFDSPADSSSFNYYSSDEMKNQLKVIRNKVENNEFSTTTILHISIPHQYFLPLVNNDKISILDLPGVESRNKRERAYVERLMTRYIPISSVCIIACPANSIQSLESEEISQDLDWKRCAHKFLLVLTKSYSDGSIKSHFNVPRKERQVPFEIFVKDRFQEELNNVIGNHGIEIYPLDLGDSFEKLLSDEIHDSEDCKEIRSTRDSILSALQESIVKHKGEQLFSTIKELHNIVEHYENGKISQLQYDKKRVKDEINNNNKSINSSNDKIKNFNKRLEDLQKDNIDLGELRKEIENLSFAANTITQKIVSSINDNIKSLNLSKNGFLNDPQKTCLDTIRSNLTKLITSLVTQVMSLMEKCDLSVDLYPQEIIKRIYSNFTRQYKDILYPPPSGFIQRLFGNAPKISVEDFKRVLQNIENIIREEISSNINPLCLLLIGKKDEDYKKNTGMLKRKIENNNSIIQSLIESNEKLEVQIQGIDNEIAIVESQKERDKQTLQKYLEYCEFAYLCQREDLIKKINSNASKEERILYLLLLGVIDKEYNIIINTSNG